MDRLMECLNAFSGWLWGNWLLFVLLGIGVLYTVITGGVQVRHFGYILKKTLWEPIRSGGKDAQEKGAISSFQALCTAVASCVGSGNIVGVSTALLAGGLGALFWMWVAAFVGMATKYGEIILGMLYREKDDRGNYIGGPMYYIRKGLNAPILAAICAGCMVIQIISGNFIQSNTIAGVLMDHFRIPHLVTGVGLMVVIFIITVGGMKRLAHVAERMVPLMACIYTFGGIVIILANITKVPGVIADIFAGAFGLRAVAGGAMGSMVVAMQKGIARGLYSNEAGEGSAPVIHSAASVKHPAQQGLTGVTEVFVDTFVLCTITGLVLGVTGVLEQDIAGNLLAIYAFGSVWSPLRYVVAFSLLLFCLTTLMSQWYFGYVGLSYMFQRKTAEKFKYVFPCFCIIGALAKIELVWTLQDIALGLLTLPNLIALLVLWPKVRAATKEFFDSEEFRK